MALMIEDERAKELLDLAKDNNRMLRSMRRNAFIGGIFKTIFWVATLIVLPYLTWLYIQPYLEGAISAYSSVQGETSQVSDALKQLKDASGGVPDFQGLLKQFGIGG